MTFEELLQDNNIPVAPTGHHHQTYGWVQFDCPFCGTGSHKYHMGYNPDGGFVNCWKCGGHSLLSTIAELYRIPHHKAKKILKDLGSPYQRTRDTHLHKKVSIPFKLGPLEAAHFHYLKGRGFNPAELQTLWQIKGIGIYGKWSWRIFIPIINEGKTVSWTTRSLSNTGQRYVSASEEQESISHKTIPYGLDYVRNSVIITEGPFDVWKIGPGAVCTFGTTFTTAQIGKLIRVRNRYVCFDSERNAQKQAHKLLDALGAFPGYTSNIILDAHDPGEARTKELTSLRKLLRHD